MTSPTAQVRYRIAMSPTHAWLDRVSPEKAELQKTRYKKSVFKHARKKL